MIGIFIPTYNRPEFLQRAFSYYGSKYEYLQDVVFHIYDASAELPYTKNIKTVEQYKSTLKINHIRYKDNSEFVRLFDSTKNIQEEYILQTGDDDFIIAENLKPQQLFLDSNKDYIACSGMRMSFTLENPDEKQVKGENLHVTRSIPGPYWPVNDPVGCFRSYMRSGIPMQHFLVRNEIYQKMYAHLEHQEFQISLLSQDLLPCAMLSLSGNIKRLDFIVSYMRQESNLSTYKYLDEIMLEPNFPQALAWSKIILVRIISGYIGGERASEVVDGEFVIRFMQLLKWRNDVKYSKNIGEYPLRDHDFIPSTQAHYHQLIKEIFQVCRSG